MKIRGIFRVEGIDSRRHHVVEVLQPESPAPDVFLEHIHGRQTFLADFSAGQVYPQNLTEIAALKTW